MNELMSRFKFPDPAKFQHVAIVPVYVEPLAYSGERLFVGLIVQSSSGAKSFPLEGLRRLQCVYGPAYRSLIAARDIALASLLEWVNQHGMEQVAEWTGPGDGIFAGSVLRTTTSSVAEAVRASFAEYSSIYEEPVAFAEQEPSARDERLASLTASRLEATVRDLVAAVRPVMAPKFFQKFQVNDKARPMTLGFVGTKLVANFGLIVPQALSTRVSTAKARLWDLASAREGAEVGWFGPVDGQEFGLLLHHATDNDVQYSQRQLNSVREALVELEAEADKLDLRCRPIVGAQGIADHLMRAEA